MPRKGKLKPEDELKVQKNYRYIKNEIDAKYIAAFLYEKDVISMDDKYEIHGTVRKDERNQLLLDMILNSGSGGSFQLFLDSLKDEYPHVAEKLVEEDGNVVHIPAAYSWYDDISPAIKDRVIQDCDASRIAPAIGTNWELLMMRIGLRQIEIEHEKSRSSSIILNITHLLIKWRQRYVLNATIHALMQQLIELEDTSVLTIDWELLKRVLQTME